MARSKAHVAVTDPSTGDTHWFKPGDELPGWALREISNPAVLDDSDPEAADAETGAEGDAAGEQPGAEEGADGDGATAEEEPAAGEEVDVDGFDPDASVKDIVDWVGDSPDRAQVALDAEQAKGDQARTTLVNRLQQLIDGD